MNGPMSGVRILEVAQFTFVPAAGAVLADWGADVIKVEHAVTGDAQRGLLKVLGLDQISAGSSFVPIMEGPNRGKRSIGLALENPEAMAVLHELIRTSDVFLTNFLPGARAKLGIDLEDVRAINPNIIYVRGSGFGARGPDADKGGYDSTAFWARGGTANLLTPPSSDKLCPMPTGAYGDSMGGMTIAGGIAAALFKRATTGESSVVDVSLLSVGAWATQFASNLSLMVGGPLPVSEWPAGAASSNPLTGAYKTSDGRWVMLTMLQPGRYWPEFVAHIGKPELANDERFDSAEKIMANTAAAAEIVAGEIASRTLAQLVEAFDGMDGQWAIVQNSWEVANDEALVSNGYIADVTDAEGVGRKLIANPVQFDETPVSLTRAPLFAEHTDSLLRELGYDDDRLIELKISGAVT